MPPFRSRPGPGRASFRLTPGIVNSLAEFRFPPIEPERGRNRWPDPSGAGAGPRRGAVRDVGQFPRKRTFSGGETTPAGRPPPATPGRVAGGRSKRKEPPPCGGRVRGSPPLTRRGLLKLAMSSTCVPRIRVPGEEDPCSLRRPVGMLQTPPLSHPPGGLLDESPASRRERIQFSREHEILLRPKRIPVAHPFGMVYSTWRTTSAQHRGILQDITAQILTEAAAAVRPPARHTRL